MSCFRRGHRCPRPSAQQRDEDHFHNKLQAVIRERLLDAAAVSEDAG